MRLLTAIAIGSFALSSIAARADDADVQNEQAWAACLTHRHVPPGLSAKVALAHAYFDADVADDCKAVEAKWQAKKDRFAAQAAKDLIHKEATGAK